MRLELSHHQRKWSLHSDKENIVKATLRSRIFVWLLLISGVAFSDSSTDILPTDDWSAEVTAARKAGLPLLILFGSEHCGYCERLKSEVLEPLAQNGDIKNFVWIRELDIKRGGKIRDFDGERIRTKIFVDRYGVYATPTLVLVDNQGKPLGTPLVGYDNAEDYRSYLENFLSIAYREPKKLNPVSDNYDGSLVLQDRRQVVANVPQVADIQ